MTQCPWHNAPCVAEAGRSDEISRLTATLATETAAREAAEQRAGVLESSLQVATRLAETVERERDGWKERHEQVCRHLNESVATAQRLVTAEASLAALRQEIDEACMLAEIGTLKEMAAACFELGQRATRAEAQVAAQAARVAGLEAENAHLHEQNALRDEWDALATPAPLDPRVRAALRAAQRLDAQITTGGPFGSTRAIVSPFALQDLIHALAAVPPRMLEDTQESTDAR